MKEPVVYVDRKGTSSLKWDHQGAMFGEEGLLPLWVADMDFRVPQCVIDACQAYLDKGVFAYYRPPQSYYQAFIAWQKQRHGIDVQQAWLRFAPGVVPGINWLLQLFTKPQDAVMVLTPVYYPFLSAVRGNERRLVCCELNNDSGRYSVDMVAFEAAIREQNIKCFILSSPHNPVGRVWKREELTAMLDICKAHGVLVISDEIHQDLVFGGHKHVPSALAGDYANILITLAAASKTFNLAGCQNSFVIIPDETMRGAYDNFTNRMRITNGNAFGYIATEAAYRGGHAWLEQARSIIWDNYLYAKDAFERELPGLVVSALEGTYLMWVDFGAYLTEEAMADFFQRKCRIAVDYGFWFEGNARCHARINLATSRENVQTAINAIISNLQAK